MTGNKIKIIIKLILLMLAFICQATLFSVVSASDECAGEAKMFIVTKEQSGGEIKVKPGDIIQIELLTLGSAGYNWYIDHIDGEYLELISEKSRQVSEGGRIGAPVVMMWQFKVKKQGTAEIKMDCYRKWEGIEKSVDHFFLKINISEKGE